MAAPLQTAWEELFGLAFVAGTPSLPVFGRGETVWKKAEFDGALSTWNKDRKYTIADYQLFTIDDSGAEKFQDKNGNVVTNAGTQPGDETTGWFYRLLRDGTDDEYEEGVHESELLGEAAMETYVQTQIATFIS